MPMLFHEQKYILAFCPIEGRQALQISLQALSSPIWIDSYLDKQSSKIFWLYQMKFQLFILILSYFRVQVKYIVYFWWKDPTL